MKIRKPVLILTVSLLLIGLSACSEEGFHKNSATATPEKNSSLPVGDGLEITNLGQLTEGVPATAVIVDSKTLSFVLQGSTSPDCEPRIGSVAFTGYTIVLTMKRVRADAVCEAPSRPFGFELKAENDTFNELTTAVTNSNGALSPLTVTLAK